MDLNITPYNFVLKSMPPTVFGIPNPHTIDFGQFSLTWFLSYTQVKQTLIKYWKICTLLASITIIVLYFAVHLIIHCTLLFIFDSDVKSYTLTKRLTYWPRQKKKKFVYISSSSSSSCFLTKTTFLSLSAIFSSFKNEYIDNSNISYAGE